MTNSDMFFLISSVGFILLFALTATLLIYLVRAVRSWNELTEKIGKNIDTVGDAGKDLIEDLRDSTAFRLFFRRGKK